MPPIEEKDDEEKKPKPEEEEEEGKEVSTEPEEKDEDEESPEGGLHAEKKRNRYREAREAAQREKERADSLERQANEERAARVAAETAARLYAQQSQAPQQQQDPWAEAENGVKEKFQYILSETNRLRGENKLDEDAAKRLQTAWIENQQKQQELTTRKLMWQQHVWNQQQQPALEQQTRMAAVEARLNAEYPEIMSNPNAKAHASAGWQMALAAGKANSWDTAKEVMAATMRAFRLGRPPPIDDATRRRYSGVGGGSNGAANGTRTTFKMTKAHEKMAEGRFPNLSPDQAHKKWAQTIGKKILEDES